MLELRFGNSSNGKEFVVDEDTCFVVYTELRAKPYIDDVVDADEYFCIDYRDGIKDDALANWREYLVSVILSKDPCARDMKDSSDICSGYTLPLGMFANYARQSFCNYRDTSGKQLFFKSISRLICIMNVARNLGGINTVLAEDCLYTNRVYLTTNTCDWAVKVEHIDKLSRSLFNMCIKRIERQVGSKVCKYGLCHVEDMLDNLRFAYTELED